MTRGPRWLILCSSPGKTPHGGLPWVQRLVEIVAAARAAGASLIVSTEPLPWLLTWRCAEQQGVAVEVVEPPSSPAGQRKAAWRERDRLAWERADVVVPLWLRPGSRWQGYLESTHQKQVLRDFQLEDPGHFQPVLEQLPPLANEDQPHDWLIHWTRRTYTPWPDESWRDFADAILAARDRYPRDAPATLAHILETGRLLPSAFRASGGQPVVSFTAATLEQCRLNFRWSARKVAPMWEPWGIALRREVAWELGARPVQYGARAEVPGWLRHGGGPFIGEAEWRFPGVLDLAQLTPKDLQVLRPGADAGGWLGEQNPRESGLTSGAGLVDYLFAAGASSNGRTADSGSAY